MDYVCTVIGNLYIKDLHLDLSYMEIIDFSQEDLKSTPQIRDCIRNHQLEVYIPSKYPLAKKFRNRNTPNVKIVEVQKSGTEGLENISKNLSESSEALSRALDKIDFLIESFCNSKININLENNSVVESILNKLDRLILAVEKNKSYDKFDEFLKKFEIILSNNSSNNIIIRDGLTQKKEFFQEKKPVSDEPIYVPDLSMSNIGKKNIKAKEESSEGTEDILEKLKKLKKN